MERGEEGLPLTFLVFMALSSSFPALVTPPPSFLVFVFLTLLLNIRGCSGADVVKRQLIGDIFVKKKFDVLALSERKLWGKGNGNFSVASGNNSGFEVGRTREGEKLSLSERLVRNLRASRSGRN